NRFDAIVTFNELEEEHLLHIFDLMLTELENTFENNDISMDITDEPKSNQVKFGYDSRYGASLLRRDIYFEIEDRLMDLILEDETTKEVQVLLEDEKIVMKKA